MSTTSTDPQKRKAAAPTSSTMTTMTSTKIQKGPTTTEQQGSSSFTTATTATPLAPPSEQPLQKTASATKNQPKEEELMQQQQQPTTTTTTPTAAVPSIVVQQQQEDIPFSSTHLRIVSTSDTHEKHSRLTPDMVPDGDVFVHCGDIFFKSRRIVKKEEFLVLLDDFNNWLGTLRPKFRYGILVIGGNHDIWLERLGKDAVQQRLTNATYLFNSFAEVCGVRFFGCPLSTGTSGNRGFQDVNYTWDTVVPRRGVDVLLTHQPCSRKDIVSFIESTGCCRLHIAGHDHDNYGVYHLKWNLPVTKVRTAIAASDASMRVQGEDTPLEGYTLPPMPRIINEEMADVRTRATKVWAQRPGGGTMSLIASFLNDKYKPAYRPIVVDLPFDIGQGHQHSLRPRIGEETMTTVAQSEKAFSSSSSSCFVAESLAMATTTAVSSFSSHAAPLLPPANN